MVEPGAGDPHNAAVARIVARDIAVRAESLRAADDYLREFRRWRLLPVKGKVPAVPLSAATRSLAQLGRMMADADTDEFGVATGQASGLAVIDIDRMPCGAAPLLPCSWMATARIRTPRGGLHLLYALDRPETTRRVWLERLLQGVDMLVADGGWIPLPPSGGRRWLTRLPLAPLPRLPATPAWAR
ncbi:MAG: bifunctional DNA primase/polymerase [Conexibacter sp.]